MYKFFLTFRYLTRKKIVIFPILVVWLCVMMLIIVSSIMQGFVDRVRDANRDLYGDIIISSAVSSQGFENYDELSAALHRAFPDDIKAITPTIEVYSLVYAGDEKRSVPALLVGLQPEGRAQVTRFREGLFQQYEAPMDAVNFLAPLLPATRDQLVARANDHVDKAKESYTQAAKALHDYDLRKPITPAYERLWMLGVVAVIAALLLLRARYLRRGGAYVTACIIALAGIAVVVAAVIWPVAFPRQFKLVQDREHQAYMELIESFRIADMATVLPDKGPIKSRDELVAALVPAKASFDVPPRLKGAEGVPQVGCIAGSQLLYDRDTRGNFQHNYPDTYPKVSITVFPPSRSGSIQVNATNAVSQDFTVVDGSHTGMYDIDSMCIYAPFETVQFLAGMRPDPKLNNFAPRTHELLIRLTPKGEKDMNRLNARIDEFVQNFLQEHKQEGLRVQTWDQKQARYLSAVENEKTMITFIILLMSGVVLVVIFLIFYQIVRDKTRDIGIIKAVGGSESGVAGIFLIYGLMIGIVGGSLGGVVGARYFVTHTNEIHEFIFQCTGIIIWDRSVYMFDRIPDVVHFGDVAFYFCIALAAGVLGATIPAIFAAVEDPVKAVRYE